MSGNILLGKGIQPGLETREMVLYSVDKRGAFTVGCTVTGLTCFAYPTSQHARAAKTNPESVALEMLENERKAAWTREGKDAALIRGEDRIRLDVLRDGLRRGLAHNICEPASAPATAPAYEPRSYGFDQARHAMNRGSLA